MRLHVRAVAAALALTLSSGIAAAVAGVGPARPSAGVPAPGALQALVSALPPPPPAASRSAAVPPPVRAVGRLVALRPPDLLVRVSRPVTRAQLAALRDLRDLQGVTVLDLGTAAVAGRPAQVAGVDPEQFREFTPQETAQSDPLWQVVADGGLATTYAIARSRHLRLGADVPVGPSQRRRLGAVAVLGLPGIDAVVSRSEGRSLRLPTGTAVVLNAPGRGIYALRAAVHEVLGWDADITTLRPEAVQYSGRRPSTYRELYIESATLCPGLPWQVLAAIGQVESGHGRNVGPSTAGALGPMQFLPSTWAYYGVDGDGDGIANIMDPYDAVPSAALYLCRNGAGLGGQALYDAIFAYNHADWYVRLVLGLAARYQ